MPATFATSGALDAAQGGNDTGAASTGIAVGANASGPTVGRNFTDDAANDFLAHHIGGGPNDAVAPSTMSASNTGQVLQVPVTVTAGSGYTNGTYRITSTGGGVPDGRGEIEFVIAGGALTSARVIRPGSGFTGNPTWTLANARNVADGTGPGAGTLGALLTSVGLMSQAFALGTGYGTNKNTRRVTATGAVAIGAAVAPSTYINRSPRALVAGDSLWAVEP